MCSAISPALVPCLLEAAARGYTPRTAASSWSGIMFID
ncbi:hypothetical protein SX4_0836 [Vibrio mimicus SX-4]|nr:hypothetical protein SX4_0836 [Vibrio mimicus SX-4]